MISGKIKEYSKEVQLASEYKLRTHSTGAFRRRTQAKGGSIVNLLGNEIQNYCKR